MKFEISVQSGEYIIGDEGNSLVFTDDALIHNGIKTLTIPHEDVTNVQRDTDKSVAGFHTIAYGMGLVALLFTPIAVLMFLGGAGFNPVSGGSLFCGFLGALGFFWFRKLEHGIVDVLHVETPENRHRFAAKGVEDEFDKIAELLHDDE